MKTNKLNFINQNIYIGIDVHKKSWKVVLISSGVIIGKLSINPYPKELYNYLVNNYPQANYYSVYEAGFSGFWAHRELLSLGINNIVVNPADVPTKSKERRRKTDRIDATKLARELSVGHLEGIFIPDEKAEAFRALVRLHRQLTVDQARIKNRIKSLLLFLGESPSDNVNQKYWTKRYIEALRRLPVKRKEAKRTLDELLDTLEALKRQIASIVKQLKQYVAEDKEAKETIDLLMSVPGVGFILSVILYSEIIDIGRFKRLDDLAAYVGVAPAVYSSGEKEITLGLSRQRNRYIRNFIIEASWVALRKDKALQMTYGKLSRRMPKQKAIIRISRKLLNRIRHVWREREPYVCSLVE